MYFLKDVGPGDDSYCRRGLESVVIRHSHDILDEPMLYSRIRGFK